MKNEINFQIRTAVILHFYCVVINDLFGNKEYRVRISLYNFATWRWHYYVETENGMECVAERYGYVYSPFEAYSVDIDNDGRKELICNCSGSSAWVRVYRENNGVIESGGVDERGYYEEELGLDRDRKSVV